MVTEIDLQGPPQASLRTRQTLISRMREIESGRCHASESVPLRALRLGMVELDSALPDGGLRRGAVHEWIGVTDCHGQIGTPTRCRPRSGRDPDWSPPLALLAHLARQAAAGDSTDGYARAPGRLVWIGERVWPYPHVMGRDRSLLAESLWVRTGSDGSRLWATELALRSGAAAAVIADGSRFDRAATQRLQLAAEAKGGVCLLVRPPHERSMLSAAATRWWVRTATSSGTGPRWTVELLRCKGVQPAPGAVRPWMVGYEWQSGDLRVFPDVVGGSGTETDAPHRRFIA